jgi:hypothetical protein
MPTVPAFLKLASRGVFWSKAGRSAVGMSYRSLYRGNGKPTEAGSVGVV